MSDEPFHTVNPSTDDANDVTNGYWSEQAHTMLRQVAQRRLMGEADSITLNPTDLVHEVYLRLEGLRMPIADRQHFLHMAAMTMRRVLVDHARRKLSQKRGERPVQITLSAAGTTGLHDDGMKVVELDMLLTSLAKADLRKARIAELHYFGGLTQSEVATALGISAATVVRELRFLRSWVHAQLQGAATAVDKE
ncbi:ECF-type sigma factor [Dokdonella sp.]|uniref:ECF-type sigma factor n=1 Tax=Dokdonella sp. TaxID=2291710 RepID=UPI003C62748A